MRPRIIIPIFVTFFTGLILVWWFRPKAANNLVPQVREERSDSGKQATFAKSTNVLSLQPTTVASAPMLTNNVVAPVFNSNATLIELSNAMQRWSEKVHRPIKFYGKVVDENNQPISGANVKFIWTHFYPKEETPNTNAISDQEGRFSLQNVNGAGLSVYVNKGGYNQIRSLNSNNSFSYSEYFSEPFQPDANDPVIFHLRKKGLGATLITSEHGMSPDIAISGLQGGAVKRVDFFNQKVGNDGQMELSAVKPQPGSPISEWSFKISIPDGGLIEENDEFPFEAPEAGYQSMISFEFKVGQTNWTDRLQKHFYIKFGQPPKYGRIGVDTAINRGTYLQYVVNPDGSRNLEPIELQPQSPPPGMKIVIPQSQ